jgi:SAM-dependent methyltransferase
MITFDFSKIPIDSDCSVLDIGCGSGRHTAAALDRNAGLVVGADANRGDLKDAHARLCLHESMGRRGRWALTCADITHLPFAEERFDVVICSEVLEHIHEDRRAMRETVRVLKKGGLLAASVPRRWPEKICWMLSREYHRSEGGHIRIYDRRGLVQRIQSCGVIHTHTHYAHSLHAPFWWLKCLLGPSRNRLWPVKLYHRFLTWDMMKRPTLTRSLDHWLNPVLGKSLVLYFQRPL